MTRAETEAAAIKARASEEVAAERARVADELKRQVADLSINVAERVVDPVWIPTSSVCSLIATSMNSVECNSR